MIYSLQFLLSKGEGGDHHGSAQFFRGLQQICQDSGVFFIVDEVQTCGGSCGTFWAHEQWNLPSEFGLTVAIFPNKM